MKLVRWGVFNALIFFGDIMKRINEIETAKQLQNIFEKRQKGGIIIKEDAVFFNSKVIQAYESAPIAQIKIEDDFFPFLLSSPVLPHQLALYRLIHPQAGEKTQIEIKSEALKDISAKDKNMASALMSMSSIYAILPDSLSQFQKKQTSQLEILFSYAAIYIIRELWGGEFHSLPKIDNRLKPILNAWSKQWLQIYKLCQHCRDFLSDAELIKLPRAWDWLNAIVDEHRLVKLMSFYSNDVEEKNAKRDMASDIRDFVKSLRQGIAPEEIQSEKQPHLHRLLTIRPLAKKFCDQVGG